MPKIELTFTGDSPEEVNDAAKAYVATLKGTRGGKSKDDEGPANAAGQASAGQAPAPAMPPATGAAPGFPGSDAVGFAPPAGGAAQAGAGPFAPAALPSPEVSALVQRINAQLDKSPHALTPDGLNWFKNQCGPDASAVNDWATLRSVVLPKLSVPVLTNIAGLMNA